MTSPSNIVAATVTYHPNEVTARQLLALRGQVHAHLLIDNGSAAHELYELQRLVSDYPGLTLQRLGENQGVGRALNRAAQSAISMGAHWLLMLDQDSLPHRDMIAGLTAALQAYPEPARVGLIASNYLNARGSLGYTTRSVVPWVKRKVAITSGSLLSLAAYQEVGPFREDFFIDEVDHEHCLRLRCRGWLVLATSRPLMEHRLGNPRTLGVGSTLVTLSQHNPERRYYMVRNSIVVARIYFTREPFWVIRRLGQTALYSLLAITMECNRAQKLAAILRGIYDAMRSRMGATTGGSVVPPLD